MKQIVSVIHRLEIMKDIIEKAEPKPWMVEFDKGQLYAIEKVIEILFEEFNEGNLK